ncbi:hypothetical protein JCM8097_003696 [Rhodosporidiobolus ruineniae]
MASYTATFADAPALHPVLHLSISLPTSPSPLSSSSSSSSPPRSCSLYTLLDLPASFIADRYELLRLHRAGRLGDFDPEGADEGLQVVGEGDLEAPVWRAREREGKGRAAVLVRLGKGGSGAAPWGAKGKDREGKTLEVDVPLHVRYQDPLEARVAGGAEPRGEVEMEWPRVFWACEGEGDIAPTTFEDLASCPPPSLPSPLSLPLFSTTASNLTFHHLPPSPLSPSSISSCPPSLPPPLTLSLPAGVLSDLPLVESVTVLAVWAVAAWGMWSAVRSWRRVRREAEKGRKRE